MATSNYSNASVKVTLQIKEVWKYSSDYYYGTNPYSKTRELLFAFEEKYFHYERHASYNGTFSFLREISREEYDEKLLSLREMALVGDDGKRTYSLESQASALFNEWVEIGKISTTSLTILDLIRREEESLRELDRREAEERAQKNKHYARECGRVAKEMGISFENVLALGYEDKYKLLAFHANMIDARDQLNSMSVEEREGLFHEIFCCGRARKAAAAEYLGIEMFGADPNRLDFSFLEN